MIRMGLFLSLLALALQGNAAEVRTHIFTQKDCPATSPPPPPAPPGALAPILVPLVSAAVSPLVHAVLDKVTSSIKEAAKEKDFDVEAPTPVQTQFYEIGAPGDIILNEDIHCLVVVRGKLTTKPTAKASTGDDPVLQRIMGKFSYNPDPSDPNGLLSLDFPPEIYFEASIILGDDKKTFAFQPRAIYVGKFVSDNGFFGPSTRNYKVALTFTDWSTNQPFASTEFEFMGISEGIGKMACVDVKIGRDCNGEALGGLHGWFATRPATDGTQAEARKRANMALLLRQAVDDLPSPKNPDSVSRKKLNEAAAKYCNELFVSNKSKPDAQKVFDDACPVELVHAKQGYDDAKAEYQKASEKAQGGALWDKYCAPKPYGKDAAGAMKCLEEKIFPTGTRSGDFFISSAIKEQRPANKVAEFFTPTVDAVAPKLKEELVAQIDPSARADRDKAKAEAAQSAAMASRQAIVTAAQKLADAKAAFAKYSKKLDELASDANNATKLADKDTAYSEFLKYASDANEAAIAIGNSVPFPQIYSPA